MNDPVREIIPTNEAGAFAGVRGMARLALALAVADLPERPAGRTKREHLQHKDGEAVAQIRREHELRKCLNFLRRLPKNVRPTAADGDEALSDQPYRPRPDRSLIYNNAKYDPNYCPYCMKCPGLVRMRRVADLQWVCDNCRSQHQEAP